MSNMPNFEYDTFIALGGLDLCHYMEPLLSDSGTTVSDDVLNRMLSELGEYDEYHLVYALTLGIKYSPKTFAIQLPQYLAHEKGSVRCTALNSLAQLPREYVTTALVSLLQRLHTSHPANHWFADALVALHKRHGQQPESKP